MRAKIITMVVCCLLLIGASAAEQIGIRLVTREALEETRAIMADIRAGRLEEAAKKSHALDLAWDEKAKLLELFVDHGAADDVRYALSRLNAALESGDRAGAMIYTGELEGSIEQVYERQALTLENLL